MTHELYLPYYYHDTYGYLYLCRGSWCRLIQGEVGPELDPVLYQEDAARQYELAKTRADGEEA